MKRWFRVLAGIVLGALLSAAMVPQASAAPEDREFLREVYEVSLAEKSGSVQEKFTFLCPYAKAAGNITAAGSWDGAMLLQGEAQGRYVTFFGTAQEKQVPFYFEQQPEQAVVYFCLDQEKGWQKVMVPMKAADLAQLLAEQTAEGEMELVSDVQVLADSETERTMLVTLDQEKLSSKLQAYADQQAAMMAGKEAKPEEQAMLAEQQKVMKAAYASMGDMEYTLTVDKATKQMKAGSMDLTPVIRSMAKACLTVEGSKIPADQQEVLRCLIDSCSLQMSVVNVNPGQPVEVVVPDEVKQAKEFKLDEDKKDVPFALSGSVQPAGAAGAQTESEATAAPAAKA